LGAVRAKAAITDIAPPTWWLARAVEEADKLHDASRSYRFGEVAKLLGQIGQGFEYLRKFKRPQEVK
jgi:hypothetical protein